VISCDLVRTNKYSADINELSMLKRISVDYPLLCRDEVAKRLSDVAKALPPQFLLQVDSAYRTKKTQKLLWESRKNISTGLVHNPGVGESPHCTGGAVDVALLDHSGRELNLSESFLKYYEEARFDSKKVSEKALELRRLLNKVMLDHGFAPNPKEYWHFSYGDLAWAGYAGNKQLFFECDLPNKMYFHFAKRILNRVFKRIWRLLVKVFGLHTNY